MLIYYSRRRPTYFSLFRSWTSFASYVLLKDLMAHWRLYHLRTQIVYCGMLGIICFSRFCLKFKWNFICDTIGDNISWFSRMIKCSMKVFRFSFCFRFGCKPPTLDWTEHMLRRCRWRQNHGNNFPLEKGRGKSDNLPLSREMCIIVGAYFPSSTFKPFLFYLNPSYFNNQLIILSFVVISMLSKLVIATLKVSEMKTNRQVNVNREKSFSPTSHSLSLVLFDVANSWALISF